MGFRNTDFYRYMKTTRFHNFLKQCYIKMIRTYNKHEFLFKKILGFQDAQDLIAEMLTDDKPRMVSRIGISELRVMREYLYNKKYEKVTKKIIKDNAGFFPAEEEYLNRFAELNFKSVAEMDLIGIVGNKKEGTIIRKYNNHTAFTLLEDLFPLEKSENKDKNWTRALKNKKVLILHPFQDTIEKQFTKIDKIFPNEEIEYDFDLITYKAVQSLGGNPHYDSWFEAYEEMCDGIKQIDFDIAIIGAGSYGIPLAYHIKKMGKKAIHLGGSTQILFGIKGKRWEQKTFEHINRFFNSYWVRPSNKEKPETFQKVEDGTYW